MNSALPNSLCAIRTSVFNQVRNVSARSKGNRACRQDGPQKGQGYGWKLTNGNFAKQGELLVKQRRPRFFPGLNVEVKGDKISLYAAVPGRVVVSREKVQLKPDSEVATFFEDRDKDSLYKKYYHIIPKRQYNEFQLVAQI